MGRVETGAQFRCCRVSSGVSAVRRLKGGKAHTLPIYAEQVQVVAVRSVESFCVSRLFRLFEGSGQTPAVEGVDCAPQRPRQGTVGSRVSS